MAERTGLEPATSSVTGWDSKPTELPLRESNKRDVVGVAGVSESEPAQRSIEYYIVSDQHVTFIDTEIVPLVEFMTGKTLASEPSKRLICGISSGGICAFTNAWHSPTSFGRVLSHCGSFVNLRGGHNYPSMIRRTP